MDYNLIAIALLAVINVVLIQKAHRQHQAMLHMAMAMELLNYSNGMLRTEFDAHVEVHNETDN